MGLQRLLHLSWACSTPGWLLRLSRACSNFEGAVRVERNSDAYRGEQNSSWNAVMGADSACAGGIREQGEAEAGQGDLAHAKHSTAVENLHH